MKAVKTGGLIFLAFDLLLLGAQDLRALPFLESKKRLQALLADNKDQKMIQVAEHLDVAGDDVLKAACNLKLEGIVSKRLSEPYISGRTGIWTKAGHTACGRWRLDSQPEGFPAPMPRKAGRTIHYAKPELVVGFEMTSWTNDGVIRQASLQEVGERTDKVLRPDWINPPE